MSISLLVERGLWFLPIVLQAVIAVFLVRRRLHRELPCFFAYTVFQIVESTISWFIRHNAAVYFYFYWDAELASVLLEFAVIYEIFRNVVGRYERIQRVGFALYRWCAVLLLVVGTLTAAGAPDVTGAAMMEGIVALERGVRIVQAGLVFFLFIFASYLGLSWRNYLFGVALGFGLLATSELAVAAIGSHLGTAGNPLYAAFKPIIYNCSVVVWSVYLLHRQPVMQPVVSSIPKTEVAVWDQTLTELIRR
jgi:hypothetical protein